MLWFPGKVHLNREPIQRRAVQSGSACLGHAADTHLLNVWFQLASISEVPAFCSCLSEIGSFCFERVLVAYIIS